MHRERFARQINDQDKNEDQTNKPTNEDVETPAVENVAKRRKITDEVHIPADVVQVTIFNIFNYLQLLFCKILAELIVFEK